MSEPSEKIVKVIISAVIAFVSIFVLARFATSVETHKETIQSLDEKKSAVLELTAASTAVSAAITLLPGDTATPIADKFADLSTGFLIVLCAIFLEKYLVTITGYATFIFLIPGACALFAMSAFRKGHALEKLALRIAVFGIAIVLVIPASVKVSDLIEKTYETSTDELVESAKQTAEEIENGTEETTGEGDEKKGFFSGLISEVKDGLSGATAGMVEKAERTLNNFIEALAVLLVTACVIPIVVMMLFIWLVKMLAA